VRLAEIARVFALTAPGDGVHLRLQGKGRSRRKRSQAHAPVSFKLFVLSHMQERRKGYPLFNAVAREVGPRVPFIDIDKAVKLSVCGIPQ